MAEFGIKATDLQDPQGQGSNPQAPVQEPSSAWSLPSLGGLFEGLGKSAGKPYTSTINEYYKKAVGIQQAVTTGGINERQGYNQIKMLTQEYGLKVADFGPEAHKALQDSFSYIKTGGMGLDDAIEANTADRKVVYDVTGDLVKRGVAVNPVATQSQSERELTVSMAANLNNLDRIAQQTRESIQFQNSVAAADRERQKFKWESENQARQEDSRNALTALKRDGLNMVPIIIENINKMPGTQQDKALAFEKSMAGLTGLASSTLMNDPASLKSYNDSLQGLLEVGRGMFKDGADLKTMETEMQRRLTAAKLSLTDNPAILKSAALDALLPNTPSITMLASTASLEAVKADLMRGTSANIVPSVLANDVPTQKATFQTIKDTIKHSQSGTSFNAEKDLNAAGTMASSVLKTVGSVTANSGVTLEYAKDFISSPEYASLIKAGKFDADAADAARPVFQDLYVSAFGEQFFKSIGSQIGDVNYINGKPDPNNPTLGRIIDFEVDKDGKVKAVKKLDPEMKITASQLYIDRQVREAQKLADGMTKVVRASAHLDGRTDYATYWEENKHFLARGVFPPPEFVDQLKARGYKGTGSALNPANYTKSNGKQPTKE